jgi:hypothetical protein
MCQSLALALLSLVLAASSLQAQDPARTRQGVGQYSLSGPLVTATVSKDQVRFTVLALTREIQLEVFSSTGAPVFDSGRRPGNRLEWPVQDQQGPGLRDGVYSCYVTVVDLFGQLSRRWAIFWVNRGAVAFQENGERSVAASDDQERLTILGADVLFPFTLVSHDGNEGWIESGSGGLSFYAGSLSGSRDGAAHLRLTPDGNVGIGVQDPQAKLDVAGVIRASGGIQFSDGTILKMEGGFPVLVSDRPLRAETAGIVSSTRTGSTNTAGNATRILALGGVVAPVFGASGTAGRIAKFINTSDLGDSVITESAGNVGIGTNTPTGVLHIKTGSNENLFVGSNTRIGIGTTAPDKSLQIVSTPAGYATLHIGGTGDESFDIFSGMGPNVDLGPAFNYGYSGSSFGRSSGFFNVRPDPSAIPPNPSLRFMTANTQRMIITNLGNVGIGTSSPTQQLEVAGNLKVSGVGNGIVLPDGSVLTSNSAARIRAITYLAGCDSCSALADADDQRTIFVNLIGTMTINSVTCFSDAGTPVVNVQRDSGTPANILSSDLTCSTTGTVSTAIAQDTLNLNDQVHFVMVSAGGVAKRVTVIIKATVN